MDAFVTTTAHPRRPPRAPSPPRQLTQLRIEDLKRVVPLDRVVAAKEQLLLLVDRAPANAQATAQVLQLLERLGSFAVALETLEDTGIGKAVYRFRNDADAAVAAAAEALYQTWRAGAKEGLSRRERRERLGLAEPRRRPSAAAGGGGGALMSAAAAAAAAASAAAAAATSSDVALGAAGGGVDFLLQHSGGATLDIVADISAWERAPIVRRKRTVLDQLVRR